MYGESDSTSCLYHWDPLRLGAVYHYCDDERNCSWRFESEYSKTEYVLVSANSGLSRGVETSSMVLGQDTCSAFQQTVY